MARYIDADALLEDIHQKHCSKCDMYDGLKCKTCSLDDTIYYLENAPTAEVVPKSEVEDLIYKLECLLCHATGSKLSKHTYDLRTMESAVNDYVEKCCDEALAEAKSEVVREIIAEILTTNTPDIDGFFTMHETDLAELKKKYTNN